MVALFIAQLETPTARLVSSVLLIALGTAMASYGELNFSVIGVLFMFLSETFESIRLVMTQILLVGLKFHPSEPRRPILLYGVSSAPLISRKILLVSESRTSRSPPVPACCGIACYGVACYVVAWFGMRSSACASLLLCCLFWRFGPPEP